MFTSSERKCSPPISSLPPAAAMANHHWCLFNTASAHPTDAGLALGAEQKRSPLSPFPVSPGTGTSKRNFCGKLTVSPDLLRVLRTRLHTATTAAAVVGATLSTFYTRYSSCSAAVGAIGHTRQRTTIDTDSLSARGEMRHCAAVIRAILTVFIISAASGFVPTASYPVLARSLLCSDIGQPRSTQQCHWHLDGGSNSAPNGKRSLQMALSGEVVVAGLGERRGYSYAHSSA